MIIPVTVNSGDWTKTLNIDSDIFDDIFTEACTRIVEHMSTEKKMILGPIMVCNTGIGKRKKYATCNSYKVLLNAGLHVIAELFRKTVFEQTQIDWANEPFRSK
jgi:hypothetical protein